MTQATNWSLAGSGIVVRYSVAGPHMHFQNGTVIHDFSKAFPLAVEFTRWRAGGEGARLDQRRWRRSAPARSDRRDFGTLNHLVKGALERRIMVSARGCIFNF